MLSFHLLDFGVAMKKLIGFLTVSLLMLATAAPTALAHAVPIALIHTPVPNPVMTSEYGMRTHPVTGQRSFHGAIDLRAALDQKVESVFDGVVKAAGPRGLLGNAVEVFHPRKNITTIYGHLNSVSVQPGQSLKMGDTLGLAGSTGRSTGVHVHLIVREGRKGKTLNPLIALNDASFPHVRASRASTSTPQQAMGNSYAAAKPEPAKSWFTSLMESFTFGTMAPSTNKYATARDAASKIFDPLGATVSTGPAAKTARRIASEPAPRSMKQQPAKAIVTAKRAATKHTIAKKPVTKRSPVVASAPSSEARKKRARLSQLQTAMEAATRDAANYQALLKEGLVSRNEAARFQQSAITAKAALVACKSARSVSGCS